MLVTTEMVLHVQLAITTAPPAHKLTYVHHAKTLLHLYQLQQDATALVVIMKMAIHVDFVIVNVSHAIKLAHV